MVTEEKGCAAGMSKVKHTKPVRCSPPTVLVSCSYLAALTLNHSSADKFPHPLNYETEPQRSVMQRGDISPKMC